MRFFQVIFEVSDDDEATVKKIRNMFREENVVYVSTLSEKKANRILDGEDDD